jgi:hypothetical protein
MLLSSPPDAPPTSLERLSKKGLLLSFLSLAPFIPLPMPLLVVFRLFCDDVVGSMKAGDGGLVFPSRERGSRMSDVDVAFEVRGALAMMDLDLLRGWLAMDDVREGEGEMPDVGRTRGGVVG